MADYINSEELKTSITSPPNETEIIRRKHKCVLLQLKSLEERLTSLQESNQQLVAEASREPKRVQNTTNDESSVLRAENTKLKTAEEKRIVRMQEISNNFKLHMEKFEQERYDLEQKITELQKNSEESSAHSKDVSKSEFLSREHSKELERLLNNKSEENNQLEKKLENCEKEQSVLENRIIELQKNSEDATALSKDVSKNEFLSREQCKELERQLNNKIAESDQLKKKLWIIEKENAAFKINEEGKAGAIKKRLKEVVNELKEFADQLEKGKKEVKLQNERLEKHLLKKEKELFEKEEEMDVFKEQVKALQEQSKLNADKPEHASSAKDELLDQEQNTAVQSDQIPKLKADIQNLDNQLKASNEEKEIAINQKDKIQDELAQLKKTCENQKAKVTDIEAMDNNPEQSSDFPKDQHAMLEWYRTAFAERNKEIETLHSENLGLKEEIENVKEELEKCKDVNKGSSRTYEGEQG